MKVQKGKSLATNQLKNGQIQQLSPNSPQKKQLSPK
jgi:hypothetical protein